MNALDPEWSNPKHRDLISYRNKQVRYNRSCPVLAVLGITQEV